ncbi:MAG: PSD1 domain-containing protein [Cyclobacteriaceae bacterium]
MKQSGGFGLVFRENAIGRTKNDKVGIVPGQPGKSEMITRILSQDAETRMPLDAPALSQYEIDILVRWIEEGAEWQEHWAYQRPEEPEIPISKSSWGRNEIDNFIEERIKENGLTPSVQANKYDLARRVSIDLIGIPPSKLLLERFIEDNSDDAYEKLVDELLKSQKFGENWTSMWLDLARFADTKGSAADTYRPSWKYRDWVIKAFNKDMPFDQFTIEQLAGDLMPNGSLDQLIATSFHRNTKSSDEGGTSNEEYRVSAVLDRVNTTWEVWQSTTMSCVQCHSHPYEPIRHQEYYTSAAFFNNSSDWDAPTGFPLLKALEKQDSIKVEEIKEWISDRSSVQEANLWERFILVSEPKLRPEDYAKTENTEHYNRSGQDHMKVYDNASIVIKQVKLQDIDRIYLNYRQYERFEKGRITIRINNLNGPVIGEANLFGNDRFTDIPIIIYTKLEEADLYIQFDSEIDNYFCFIDGILLSKKLPGTRDEEYKRIYSQIDQVMSAPFKNLESTPVMIEKTEDKSRESNVFVRGNWLVKGEKVDPSVPKILNGANRELKNRLDLANWLVSDDNPLTARVIVNRFWEKFFGTGIVLTLEDFGTLGELPSHPKLLDWLALRFSGDWNWSMKKLMKTIVMSSTYRQSSKVSEVAKEKDAFNKWLARSPRVRLSAEQIRDQALAVSGLLSDKMYGPSVMPFQPSGVISLGKNEWTTSEGEDAFRRGVYTFVSRSSPYPSFISFDASERDVCLSRRIRTNTPLQALITLNDPVYIKAAKNLAQQLLNEEGDTKTKVKQAYYKVMGKNIGTGKMRILMQTFEKSMKYFIENKREAYQLTKSENVELASLMVMTNILMNMDEFIVKN